MKETENRFDLMEQNSNAETTQLEVVSIINNLYAEAEAVAKMSKEYAQKAIEIALECGRLLVEQRKQIAYGEWEKWCKDNLSFGKDTVLRYTKLYRKNVELIKMADKSNPNVAPVRLLEKAKIKNLKQAYIATGILPESPKADNNGTKKDSNHTRWIDGFVLWYDKINTTNPISQWSNAERSVVINDLKRLIRIHDELLDLQE